LRFSQLKLKSNGFTLIEIIIVLLIIGIAFGTVAVLFHYRGSQVEISTFVKEISATLRFARSRAVSEKKVYSFEISTKDRTYGLYYYETDSETGEEVKNNVVQLTIPDSLFINVKDVPDESISIDFFPLGNSTGATIEVSNQDGKTFFIIVNRVTGKVKVEKKYF
jgi:general secretion pathway protein H